jgi:hypothetical protein
MEGNSMSKPKLASSIAADTSSGEENMLKPESSSPSVADQNPPISEHSVPPKEPPPQEKLNPLRLDRLRKSQDFIDAVPSKKTTRIKIEKPKSQIWFQIHPDPEFCVEVPVIQYYKDNNYWFVDPDVIPDLKEHVACEILPMMLCAAITKAGDVFLLPARLPGKDCKDNNWWISLREAAMKGRSAWVKIKSNQKTGVYDNWELAGGDRTPPVWPKLSFQEMLDSAFEDRIISSKDHPVILDLEQGKQS